MLRLQSNTYINSKIIKKRVRQNKVIKIKIKINKKKKSVFNSKKNGS